MSFYVFKSIESMAKTWPVIYFLAPYPSDLVAVHSQGVILVLFIHRLLMFPLCVWGAMCLFCDVVI